MNRLSCSRPVWSLFISHCLSISGDWQPRWEYPASRLTDLPLGSREHLCSRATIFFASSAARAKSQASELASRLRWELIAMVYSKNSSNHAWTACSWCALTRVLSPEWITSSVDLCSAFERRKLQPVTSMNEVHDTWVTLWSSTKVSCKDFW